MRPRPPASGRSRSSSASESRCSSSAERRGTCSISSTARRAPGSSANSRSARAQPADEARDDVILRLGQRGQERARVAMPEERARVRDPEAVARVVLEPFEVLEVAAVRDRLDPLRAELAHLLRDRIGDGDDRVGVARDEPRDERLRLLLDLHGEPVDAPVRVRGDGVAEVGDPRHARRLLDRGSDQVHGRGRRGRHEHVDLLVEDDPPRGRDRGQRPSSRTRQGRAAGERRARPAAAARSKPSSPCSSSAGSRPRGPDVLRAMDVRLRRDRQPRRRGRATSSRPVRARASRSRAREVRGELRRPRDAAAARRREIHRHEQHLQGAPTLVGERNGAAANHRELRVAPPLEALHVVVHLRVLEPEDAEHLAESQPG